jgi:O-antigen/teichoic acid export membrane protein
MSVTHISDMESHVPIPPPPGLGGRVTRGVTWLAGAQVARRVSGLAVTAILARILVPGDIGLMTLATLATQLLGLVSELGLTSALVQRPNATERDFSNGFWLALLVSVTLAISGILAADTIGRLFHEPRIVPLLRVTMLVLPLSALGQISDVKLQRTLNFRRIATIEWMSAVVSGTIGIALALTGARVWSLVAQLIVAALITTVLRQAYAPWRPKLQFDQRSSYQLLTYGLSIVGVGLINYLSLNIDTMLVGGSLGAEALGFYALAFNLAMLPATNISGLVTRVMFPALSSLQGEPVRFREAYARMLNMVGTVTFPVIVGLGATAHLAVPLVYSDRWMPAVPILRILAIVGIFQAVNVSGVAYYALGRPYFLLAYASLSTAVLAAAFYVGVGYGVQGVAWSWAIVSPLVCIPPHLIANRLMGLRQGSFAAATGYPLGAALVMGAGVFLIDRALLAGMSLTSVRLALLVPAGIALYVAALWLSLILQGKRPNVPELVRGVARLSV